MTRSKRLTRVQVIEAIRERILRGALVPGQRLVEADLCELLNTSRGTVRAALSDLTHEGLIERIANVGARVRVVTLTEALQIVEVRMVVEALCVAHAAERITAKEVKELRKLADELKACAEQPDVEGFANRTHAIFETYVRIAKQPVAAEVLNRLRAQNTRHPYRLTYRAERPKAALSYWLDIVDAICERDPIRAQEALRRHVHNIEESMKALAEEDTPFAIVYSKS